MLWDKEYADDFMRCEKCADLSDAQEDSWCDSCKQNFTYIWKLENQNQLLTNGLDKVSKILLGMRYVIDPDNTTAKK